MSDTIIINLPQHGMTCPCCDRPELDISTNLLNIRGYKVEDHHGWWSFCLYCKVWFTDDGLIEVTGETDPAIREQWGMDRLGYYQAHDGPGDNQNVQ